MPDTLRTLLMRHKSTVGDAAFFGVMMTIGGAVLFFFDLEGHLSVDRRIDLDELLLLAVALGACIAWFGWRRILEQERQIARTTDAECRARFLADHDPLTGLPNRRRLRQVLDATIDRPPGPGLTHALLLLDLNGFKAINDVHGHGRGDEVLYVVATRFSETLRDGDLLVRVGGDEFALVVRDVPGPEGAATVARRLMAALAMPIAIDQDAHAVGTGIGIALFPADGAHNGELMRKADVALYKAKGEGKDSAFVFYHESMDREAIERESLLRDLAAAVEGGDIVPFYQPIVDLRTGEIRAFEALARWTHPTMGAIPPDRFIPLAEDSGIIRALSDQLLSRACADARQWPTHVGLAFNISPVDLRDQTFGLRILRIVGASGLSLKRLELEINERAIMRDFEAARGSLEPLHEAGVRIVLDDFGTGATSLAHLRSFKFDGIKIDRRFIDLMTHEKESAAIVRAIVGLASGLGLAIVAEGIEQMAQSAALLDEGCRVGQGYFFGRAVPAAETAAFFGVAARKAG